MRHSAYMYKEEQLLIGTYLCELTILKLYIVIAVVGPATNSYRKHTPSLLKKKIKNGYLCSISSCQSH